MLTVFLVLSLIIYCFMLFAAGVKAFNSVMDATELMVVAVCILMAFMSGLMLAQHGWKGL